MPLTVHVTRTEVRDIWMGGEREECPAASAQGICNLQCGLGSVGTTCVLFPHVKNVWAMKDCQLPETRVQVSF